MSKRKQNLAMKLPLYTGTCDTECMVSSLCMYILCMLVCLCPRASHTEQLDRKDERKGSNSSTLRKGEYDENRSASHISLTNRRWAKGYFLEYFVVASRMWRFSHNKQTWLGDFVCRSMVFLYTRRARINV